MTDDDQLNQAPLVITANGLINTEARASDEFNGRKAELGGPDEIEMVYSYLLANLRRTAKAGPEENKPRNAALRAAIECFEAEWPAACEQFRKRWSR